MKKTILLFFLTFIISWGSIKAQALGSDYIICIDNSGSINDQSFNEITKSAIKLIDRILECNVNNRVAVVHYGTALYQQSNSTYVPRIYIESDFTNDPNILQGISRKLTAGDHFHEALGLIGNALDNINNPQIVSPQKTLATNSNTALNVILFTDAFRASGDLTGGSYLVNFYNPNYGQPQAFTNVTHFKKNRNARFSVVQTNTDPLAIKAGAAIASVGGSYNGTIEFNIDDPDYGLLPRLYFGKTNFILESDEIDEIIKGLCHFTGDLKFWYEPNGCGLNTMQSIVVYPIIPSGASNITYDLSFVNIATNETYPVTFNPTMIVNQLAQYMIPSNFNLPPGTGGQYKFLLKMTYDWGGLTYVASSWNINTDAIYDVSLDCSKMSPVGVIKEKKAILKGNETLVKAINYKIDMDADPNHLKKTFIKKDQNIQKLQLSPNPTSDNFKIILNKSIASGTLQVTDFRGNIIYNKILLDQKQIEVDLSSQKEGIYIVNITTDKDEIYSEKIIKK